MKLLCQWNSYGSGSMILQLYTAKFNDSYIFKITSNYIMIRTDTHTIDLNKLLFHNITVQKHLI